MTEEEEEVIYVSIGEWCIASMCLQQLGLRNGNYYFDYIFSEIYSVLKIINNNFTNHFNKNDFKKSIIDGRGVLQNSSTSFVYPHDLQNDLANFETVQEKYNRRAQRVLGLINNKSSTKRKYVIICVRNLFIRNCVNNFDNLIDELNNTFKNLTNKHFLLIGFNEKNILGKEFTHIYDSQLRSPGRDIYIRKTIKEFVQNFGKIA